MRLGIPRFQLLQDSPFEFGANQCEEELNVIINNKSIRCERISRFVYFTRKNKYNNYKMTKKYQHSPAHTP